MDANLPVRWGVATALLIGGVACFLAACQGLEDGTLRQPSPTITERPPLARSSGARLPAFSGADPARRGWVFVDQVLWINAGDAEAYRQGLVHDGTRYVSVRSPLPVGTPADRGFRLRTNHVALHTNASWARATVVAREAEAHVTRLVEQYGETLGLRLPQGPLKLIVTATRDELERTLAGLVSHPVGWGAFYDARSGNVYMSLEPAARGALPWQADLRHEMTHQILDLSRRGSRRGRPFPVPWFWLWEGFAVWTEGLGGGPESPRLGRFRRRYASNEWTPLAEFARLEVTGFHGRHYDQSASVMNYLMDPRRPDTRLALLGLVRDLLRGPVAATAFAQRTGQTYGELEGRWRQTVGR